MCKETQTYNTQTSRYFGKFLICFFLCFFSFFFFFFCHSNVKHAQRRAQIGRPRMPDGAYGVLWCPVQNMQFTYTFVIGIYPAASAWRRVFMLPSYKNNTHIYWSKTNLWWLQNPLVCFLMKMRNAEMYILQMQNKGVKECLLWVLGRKKGSDKALWLDKIITENYNRNMSLVSDEDIHVKSNLFITWCTLTQCYQYMYRDDSRLAPSQWETSLQSNAVSHWLGANLESALYVVCHWQMQDKDQNIYPHRHSIHRPHRRAWSVFCEYFEKITIWLYLSWGKTSLMFLRWPPEEIGYKWHLWATSWKLPASYLW